MNAEANIVSGLLAVASPRSLAPAARGMNRPLARESLGQHGEEAHGVRQRVGRRWITRLRVLIQGSERSFRE
jgi:hypothetical protein